jgi:hypothetical protein
MADVMEHDLNATLESIECLETYQESLLTDQVSLESTESQIDYLRVRQLNELESRVGMEAFTFEDVKDMFGAIGRASIAAGRGFMKALDTIHQWVDKTHLVRLKLLRQKVKLVSPEEAKVSKGRMERARLAAALAINGDIPASFPTYAAAMVDFSRRTANNVIPDLASMNRQIAQRLEAKRWMGLDAFNAEVLEIVKIIGAYKLPMARYSDQDFQRLYPGNRSIFSTIKPNRPRREPSVETAAAKKVIEGLSTTNVGIRKRSDAVSGKAENILPILTPEECIEILDAAEIMLKEAVRIAQASKVFAKDQMPSTLSMMLSGLYHGVKRQVDDIWTAQDDGFDVIEGAHQGGNVKRHKPGKRTMLGGGIDGGGPIGMLSIEEVSLEAEKDPEAEHAQRTQMAVWVSRYLKLPLIDHQKTSQAVVLLLVGVARSYLDYVEESIDYYA